MASTPNSHAHAAKGSLCHKPLQCLDAERGLARCQTAFATWTTFAQALQLLHQAALGARQYGVALAKSFASVAVTPRAMAGSEVMMSTFRSALVIAVVKLALPE